MEGKKEQIGAAPLHADANGRTEGVATRAPSAPPAIDPQPVVAGYPGADAVHEETYDPNNLLGRGQNFIPTLADQALLCLNAFLNMAFQTRQGVGPQQRRGLGLLHSRMGSPTPPPVPSSHTTLDLYYWPKKSWAVW